MVVKVDQLSSKKDYDYYSKAIEYGSLRQALKEVCRGIRWKDSVVGYESNGLKNTLRLMKDLEAGTYKLQKYQVFKVHEPKEREVVATRLRDRQFQRALCNAGLYEDITEHFIRDNCACQKGKGTDDALKRLTCHLRNYYHHHGFEGYYLRCDIKSFFKSIDHRIAKKFIKKYVRDSRARKAVYQIIDSFGDVGIGLGSEISQLIALLVLNDLDHYIKEVLGIKYYIRYMDDFILIHHDKEYLKYCWSKIVEKVSELNLELSKDKTYICKLSQGIPFLQWKFKLTTTGKVIMKLSKNKIYRERRRLRKLIGMEVDNEIPVGTAFTSLVSWIANANRGDSYYTCVQMIDYYVETYERLLEERRCEQ